ncbi:Uncharacterized protein DAT39_011801 [Clarias magur]|uniref:Uncharacterized protein n=1 Tax=Clarias magur TaxID=1594786 RepID=A0A8J4U0K5_CLAMG|nr:Uncharacterized protein DAT39_011801 [Clarias magur]
MTGGMRKYVRSFMVHREGPSHKDTESRRDSLSSASALIAVNREGCLIGSAKASLDSDSS